MSWHAPRCFARLLRGVRFSRNVQERRYTPPAYAVDERSRPPPPVMCVYKTGPISARP